MSPNLFHKLEELHRRRKLQSLAKLDETLRSITRLETKIADNEKTRKQALLSINQAMLHLTLLQSVGTQEVYDVRLLEAAMRRNILQLETEAIQYQKDKTHHESEAQNLRKVVRYFGIKEEKMARAKARSEEESCKR
ncbi:hypothetical protein SC171_21745 [Pantoea cypripedii]|uniref:hypothetical protein n=1 Tax=Pantoea cypripedii TaxID=55209 RepID=UPI002FCB2AB9